MQLFHIARAIPSASAGRQLARSAYIALARVLRFDERLLRRIAQDRAAIVLSLHRVSPDRNDFYPPIHPRAFDELVSFLVSRFEVTTFSGAARTGEGGRPVAVLSFDDGYHDFVEHAMPILARYGVRANQNVIGSTVLSARAPWTQRLMDFLSFAPGPLLREFRLPGFDRPAPGPRAHERESYGVAIAHHLIALTRAERAPLLTYLDREMSRIDAPATRMMDLRDVREAATQGHEIGAHSFDHDPMQLESLDTFREDLDRCETVFREQLALPLEVYAFPFGGHRTEQVDLLLQQGIRAVLVVGDGYASRDGPVYRRFNVGARNPYLLRLEALGIRARRFPL